MRHDKVLHPMAIALWFFGFQRITSSRNVFDSEVSCFVHLSNSKR
jgi:hypothetical protein